MPIYNIPVCFTILSGGPSSSFSHLKSCVFFRHFSLALGALLKGSWWEKRFINGHIRVQKIQWYLNIFLSVIQRRIILLRQPSRTCRHQWCDMVRPTKIAEHRHTLTGLTVHHFGALSVPIYNHTRQLLGTLDVRVWVISKISSRERLVVATPESR